MPSLRKVKNIGLDDLIVQRETVEEIIALAKERLHADVVFTTHSGHGMELAKKAVKRKYDLIVAAGGDGTVNEVINGIAQTKATLGIIPLGTTNVMAMELGIPLNGRKAIEIIAKGKKKSIDLGLAKTSTTTRYFGMCAGIGFDASVIREVDSVAKKWLGSFAFGFVALKKALTYRWHPITVEKDVRTKGYVVVVCNSRYYGGDFELTHHASLTDGKLDLFIWKQKHWWNALRFLFALFRNTLHEDMITEYHQFKKINVIGRKNELVHVDCELIGKTPVEITVAPNALRVIYRTEDS